MLVPLSLQSRPPPGGTQGQAPSCPLLRLLSMHGSLRVSDFKRGHTCNGLCRLPVTFLEDASWSWHREAQRATLGSPAGHSGDSAGANILSTSPDPVPCAPGRTALSYPHSCHGVQDGKTIIFTE